MDEIAGQADAPTKTVLESFCTALARISVPVCTSPIPRTTLKAKKRSRQCSDDDDDDDCVLCTPIKCARPSATECAAMDDAPPVIVPVGACPGDRLTFYDCENKVLTHQYVTVPADVLEGKAIPNFNEPVCGAQGCRVLIVDGPHGMETAARQRTQHAIRLHVHKKRCANTACNVLGCRDACYDSIFKDEGTSAAKHAFEAHWVRQRRNRRTCARP